MTQSDPESRQRELIQSYRKVETLRQEAQQLDRAGRTQLQRVRLGSLLDNANPSTLNAAGGASPATEVGRSVATARQAVANLHAAADQLTGWRERQRKIIRFIVIANIVFFVGLLILGYYACRQATLNRHYREATVALEAGQWTEARSEFLALLAMDPDYRDAATLLRETYYRPAVQALEMQNWNGARQELEELLGLDAAYRDAFTLLLESHYRPAVAALEAQEWDTAHLELELLVRLDAEYRDAAM